MYGKLVRDNIPEIIIKNGKKPLVKVLDNEDDYIFELEKKLEEESQELFESSQENRINELADILEVIIALAKYENKTFADLLKICEEKRNVMGSFNKKIYLEDVK
ncbi:MAG: phosphoribosyl-ATP pyrophosphohydrolase [Firmicutes bacterium]|nr:phosphoribosyl-ATP pyrophosphohydrolase [Bacillota bacterium]